MEIKNILDFYEYNFLDFARRGFTEEEAKKEATRITKAKY